MDIFKSQQLASILELNTNLKAESRMLTANKFAGTKVRCNEVIILAGINPLLAKFKSWKDN